MDGITIAKEAVFGPTIKNPEKPYQLTVYSLNTHTFEFKELEKATQALMVAVKHNFRAALYGQTGQLIASTG